MNKNTWFPIIAIIAALAAAGCNRAGKLNQPSRLIATNGPVELKLKWTAGERVLQSLDMKMKSETTLPGQATPMQQNMTLGQKFALTVLKETPAGGHELEMEFLSARMGMAMGGKTVMEYDSSQASANSATNPLAGVFGKMVGAKIRFVMDASNQVERVVGVDDLLNRLAAGGPAQVAASIKGIMNEGYFKQMMSANRFMPPKAVAPGDSWPMQQELPLAALGTFKLDYTITFDRWEMRGKRNCARLEFQGTLASKPGANPNALGMTMAIEDGATSGTAWFDPELGITIDTVMNQDMTMKITLPSNPKAKAGTAAAGPQIITTQMRQTIQIKLDSVN